MLLLRDRGPRVSECIELFIFFFLIFFPNRFIILRRYFLMLAVLFLMRALTMFVTVLPISSDTYFCSPKLEDTPLTPAIVIDRALGLLSGFGLPIYGKQTFCGDSIYSGHTVMLIMFYLLFTECKYEAQLFLT
jgi:shingomyelin synthase